MELCFTYNTDPIEIPWFSLGGGGVTRNGSFHTVLPLLESLGLLVGAGFTCNGFFYIYSIDNPIRIPWV